MNNNDEKTSWPELIGVDVEKAVETIRTENGNLNVQKLKDGSMCTMDYRTNRVRVFYNPQTNLVSNSPLIG